VLLLVVTATATACSRRESPSTTPVPPLRNGAVTTTPDEPRRAPPKLPAVDNGAAAAIRGRIALARELVGALAGRELSDAQRLNADTASAFLDQADRALTEGDPARAVLLTDKGTILLEAVERATRPN
jgi:hypothetical protein